MFRQRSQKTQSKAIETSPTDNIDQSLPIVGIGSSAGGLEPCLEIFKNLPNDTGMAFVLIQHLAPD